MYVCMYVCMYTYIPISLPLKKNARDREHDLGVPVLVIVTARDHDRNSFLQKWKINVAVELSLQL